MKFKCVEPNSHFRSLRLLSEDGRWELGLSPYSHGMRLRMGMTGRPPQVIDFCMGRDATLFSKVLVAVLSKLETLDESITPEQVDAAFPWSGTRPDMAVHLTELRAATAESIPCSACD
ncbi:MAG: hypothetical protein ABIS50_00420 [Luteolibacter sp.]|uniref:hypothetical protein n=1 Tax=Luteolibacter sp. TaxID=1962973 RepID=UPI003267D001